METTSITTFSELLRIPGGQVNLSDYGPRDTPGFDGNKKDGKEALAELEDELDRLQERLYAHGRAGGDRRLLIVIQGMDTAGKGGVCRHVVGQMDPQGVEITAFKKPTPDELRRGFLWRIRSALPDPGYIGVFDRSHYEDVLVARVNALAPPEVIERRYESINSFEAEITESGCVIVKVMLHISRDEQRERLAERLDREDKHWKYSPGDVDERRKWDDYQRAYEIALERCNTEVAPWYIVPADRKWYRNLAISHLLIEHLRSLDLAWPKADFDVEHERERLANS